MNKLSGSGAKYAHIAVLLLVRLVSIITIPSMRVGNLPAPPGLAPRALASLLLALAAPTALSQPTVNGLFYGDGDNASYSPYATSEYGSTLYTHLDVSTSMLHVALVVDQSVNDNVCSPVRPYTTSAGWNPPRSCNRLTDSEYASFTLECAPGSANTWSWQQGHACPTTAGPPASNWVSDATCGASAGTPPPGLTSSSAFAANANAYQNNPSPAWNMYTSGNTVGNWTSPFVNASPNDVTQVPGYPTYSGGNYQWEWSMVYEWSVNLGPEGTNCGDQPIFVVTGLSHHSPSKNDDENDDFPPPEDLQFSDWGDAPDSYGTTRANDGARHYITVTGPYFGNEVQGEPDGTPTVDATGDGAEEDGVTFTLLGANTLRASVEVVNNTGGSVTVCAWLDIPSGGSIDGTFDAGDGLCQDTSLSSTTLTFDWSGLPVDQQYDTYARFRITGDTLTTSDATGTVSNGEIEDYTVSFDFTPTAATIGEVNLEAASLEGFVTGLALQDMNASELADLLKVWDPEAASALAGADRAALLDAVLNYLDPDRDGQLALLRWDTLEQRGTIGFYVERTDGADSWSRINKELLPALIDAPMGAEYQLVDPTARPGQSYQYRLIEQEAAGTTRVYGPYTVEMP